MSRSATARRQRTEVARTELYLASAGGRRERLPARVPFPRVFCGPEAREGVRAKSLRGSRADFAYFVSPTPEGPDSSSKVGRDSSWP